MWSQVLNVGSLSPTNRQFDLTLVIACWELTVIETFWTLSLEFLYGKIVNFHVCGKKFKCWKIPL